MSKTSSFARSSSFSKAKTARSLAMWTGVALILPALLAFASPAQAGDISELTPNDYRLFCGYLDALENPAFKKYKGKKRDAKIARAAKTKRKKLMKAVAKVKAHGATCDEVGKLFEVRAKAAVDKALPGRVDLFFFDGSDPSHVVASVRWVGGDKKKLVQEATVLSRALYKAVPIAKTLALRGINPRAGDKASKSAIWFEARMTASRAANIDEAKIKDYANTRYIRLFDGVQCGKMVAAPTALGGARGPCKGKEIDLSAAAAPAN